MSKEQSSFHEDIYQKIEEHKDIIDSIIQDILQSESPIISREDWDTLRQSIGWIEESYLKIRAKEEGVSLDEAYSEVLKPYFLFKELQKPQFPWKKGSLQKEFENLSEYGPELDYHMLSHLASRVQEEQPLSDTVNLSERSGQAFFSLLRSFDEVSNRPGAMMQKQGEWNTLQGRLSRIFDAMAGKISKKKDME